MAILHHLTINKSDGKPIMLEARPTNISYPKPYATLLKDPTCKQVISEAWSKNFQGSSPFILSEKINNTKNALKLWSKTHFGHIEEDFYR